MKRLCTLVASLTLFTAACGQTTKNERTRSKSQSMGSPLDANPSDASPSDELPVDETPSTEPVDDAPVGDVPGGDDTETPVKDPVVQPPVTQPAPPPVNPAPPIKWDNGVPAPTAAALDAAIKGKGVGEKIAVYGYKWRIERASLSRDGDTIKIAGQFKHSDWWIDDKINYEFTYVNGKLEASEIFIDDTQSPFVIVGPILAAVGLAYGVPIPVTAVTGIVLQIEKMVVGNWQEGAQKLALRIGMEGFRQASLHGYW